MRSHKNKRLDFQTHFNPNNFFQVILKEIDETFSDEELDGICSDMDPPSIDFNEFVKIMS